MSGWGETEKLYASKELLWTHERAFKYNADLISRKLIYQTGNPEYNFMGEKKTKNGGCTGDSGGKPSDGRLILQNDEYSISKTSMFRCSNR